MKVAAKPERGDCLPRGGPYRARLAWEEVMTAIESPCNKTCTIDAGTRLCLGCGRNLVEIERWAGFTEQQRAQVMAELPRRLAALSVRRSACAQGL
jgi:predicted Fe-S protein YdhL (DUF1289 family)